MPIMLPPELAGLLGILGFDWPQPNEDNLMDFGQAWMDFGDELGDILGEADGNAVQAWTDQIGKDIEAFKTWWEGKETATFTPVHGDGGPPTSCPMPAVRSAVETYWRFLLTLPANPNVIRSYHPDLPPHLASLLQWKDYWQRPHPYRGRIEGIPSQGPD